MDESQRVLEGIRVVEVATMVLAPSAAAIMADFGAEVVKVESPGAGDIHRYGHQLPGMPISGMPYVFEVDNRNKQSIVLDLKNEQGAKVLRELLANADVFITNMRPAALEGLSITYDDLKTVNPRLVYALASGYGEKGPEKDKPGYDAVCYWSRSGIERTIFPAEGSLGPIPYGSGDHPTGLSLLSAIMFGLFQRERTGEGSKVSTSLLASGIWANANMLMAELCGAQWREPRTRENAYTFAFLYYTTGDGQKLKLIMYKHDAQWPAFCQAMGREELIDDPKYVTLDVRQQHIPELIRIFDEAFAEHDLDYWNKRLAEYDIPFTPLPTILEAAADEQIAANGIYLDVEDSRYGKYRTINSPFEVSGQEKVKPRPAPDLGEHTLDVLAAMNYSEKEIANLIASGAAVQNESKDARS